VNPKIDTITIGVTDVSRARHFYEDGFGLPVRQADGECVTLGFGGESSALELCPWDALAGDAGMSPESSGFRGFTLSYIVEQAADVDDMLTRLVHAGGEISKLPKFAFWGYSAHVTDPSGHLWKIASPKRKSLIARKRAANGVPDPVAAQELALTIGVADMKRAKEFYKDGLGNPTKKDYAKFVSFEGGQGTPDLAMYKWDALADDADVAPAGSGFRGFRMSHIVDSADSVDRLVNKATRAGAKVLRGANNTSGGPAAYFSDPDGYLWKVAAPASL
jgi:catechol 2,3-dioxygenase-like lactoylglutathione lyase family enzyme